MTLRGGHRLRVLSLRASLALAVPALALGGGTASAASAGVAVSASAAGCTIAGTTIVCRINASWSALEGADHYTISVTRPDASVIEFGGTASTGKSMLVPYAGSGTYSVRVTAWGSAP